MFDSGTVQVVKVAGIPVRLHWSFILIFLWVGYTAWREDRSATGFIFMQFFVLILFVCVLLHEFGHALMAKRYGHVTRDIVLTPIGGIARLESFSEQPKQEFWIALAGPLVNVVIALIVLTFLYMSGYRDVLHLQYRPGNESFFYDFLPLVMVSNFLLAAFNLLPAFPMDGGRILRALLSLRWSRWKATLIAARLGQFFALVFLLYAISQGQWMLCLISVFIFLTADSELKQTKWESILVKKTARDIINTSYDRLQINDSILLPMKVAASGIEKNYLVLDGMQLSGFLPHTYIVHLLKNNVADALISSVMCKDVESARPDQSLKEVYHRMQLKGVPVFAIMEDDHVLGTIEESQIRKFIDIQLETI